MMFCKLRGGSLLWQHSLRGSAACCWPMMQQQGSTTCTTARRPFCTATVSRLLLRSGAGCSGFTSSGVQPLCPPVMNHPAYRTPAVKSPNLLVDTHWRCKVAGERPANYRSWLPCAPGSLPACFTIQLYLLWQHLMRPLPQSLLFEDFNLSKILAGGQQPVASSGGAPLNPTCKWSAGSCLVKAAGRGWLPRAADRSQASHLACPTTLHRAGS